MHHYGEAAMLDKAIGYWHLAGKSSVAKSAVHEAIAQLRRGLSMLDGLPETRERKQLELDISRHLDRSAAAFPGDHRLVVDQAQLGRRGDHQRAHEVLDVEPAGAAGARALLLLQPDFLFGDRGELWHDVVWNRGLMPIVIQFTGWFRLLMMCWVRAYRARADSVGGS